MDVKVESVRTFTFSVDDLKELVSDYLWQQHGAAGADVEFRFDYDRTGTSFDGIVARVTE